MAKYRRRRGASYSVKARTWSGFMGTDKAAARAGRAGAVAALRGIGVKNVAVRGMQLSAGEFKSVDVTGTPATDTASGVLLLNGMARGDEIFERNGREVTMKSIQLTCQNNVTTGTGVDQTHRVLLVYDRQANGAALTAAQVLTAVNVFSPRNLENRRRFKILMDKKLTLNASGEPGSNRVWTYYRRLRHPITFNAGDAGTVADITTGSLYLVVVGNAAAGPTAGTTTVNSRLRYQDT